MTRFTVVPDHTPRHKVRHIRSAAGRRRTGDSKVVDLRAYTGRNVLHFPAGKEPTPAA
ncbi:hypothetical protein SAMN05421505_103200 [Sinosporangium album]|uniref:Uncharacterized protein n=1 Tax=Sinosporangium album TaxID=504805 RepID=A0A1G7TBS9_9ACTN|nr:hypothetical protein [Sinosporangium album]SDG32685.1 hypothetical protein SAMN05421505_103200 [Sinosporangium album]